MYKKFLSAFNLFLICTFCSVNAGGAVEKYKKTLEAKTFTSSVKRESDAYQKIEAEKNTSKSVQTTTKIPAAPPPPVKKTVAPVAQPKSLTDQIKSEVNNVATSFKSTPAGNALFKQKTLMEQLKDNTKKREIKSLQDKQAGAVLKQDITDLSPMDKIFRGIGDKVAQTFPSTSKSLIQASMKAQNNPVSRFSKKVNAKTQAFDADLKGRIFENMRVKDTDIDAMFAKRTSELEAKIKQITQQQLEDEQRKNLVKEVKADFIKKGMTFDDQKVADEVKKRTRIAFTADEKKQAALKVRGDVEASFKSQIKAELLDAKKTNYAMTEIKSFAKKNPGAYKKQLAKIGKKMNMTSAQVKNVLENPTTATAKMHKVALEKAYLEQIKSGLGKSLLGKFVDFAQDVRIKSTSFKVVAIASVCSAIFTKFVSMMQVRFSELVVNLVNGGEISDSANSNDSQSEDASYKKGEAGAIQLTVQEKSSLDASASVINFYLTFDDFFKNVLNNFSYEDKILNAVTSVSYSGGSVDSGVVIAFDYEGAGNIADGLTPVTIKMYPEIIGGQPVSFDSIVESVNNPSAMELMGAIMNNSPELIFLIKAISLLNFANKTYSDASERLTFLGDELDKLFIRLIWTVDDRATSRSNALEANDDKWESIYMREVSSCLFNGPECIKSVISDQVVVGVTLDDGTVADLAYEQYIVDRYEDFKVLKTLPFQGDVDYQEDQDPITSTEIKQIIFAIFLRALKDVVWLEKNLAKKADTVILRDFNGKTENFVGKTFYEQVTKKAFDSFKVAQAAYVNALVEYGSDVSDKEAADAFGVAEKKYLKAAGNYDISALNFRKKVCMYEFDRTQGLEPETVLDFLVRELKRYYNLAKDKTAFESDLLKIFTSFDSNFPFTGEEILSYAKDSSPIKPPVQKVIIQTTDVPQISGGIPEITTPASIQVPESSKEIETASDPVELSEASAS